MKYIHIYAVARSYGVYPISYYKHYCEYPPRIIKLYENCAVTCSRGKYRGTNYTTMGTVRVCFRDKSIEGSFISDYFNCTRGGQPSARRHQGFINLVIFKRKFVSAELSI